MTVRQPKALTVAIPFFNESGSAAALLDELRPVLDKWGGAYEVLAVNDGSVDDTAGVIRAAIRDWPEARLISFEKNQGQAAGLLYAFSRAAGEVIITLDGDGQNDPADIPALLAKLEEGADMVAGVRANRQDSALRKSMSRIANRVRRLMLRDQVSDSGCALKAFRRVVVGSFIPLRTLYSFMPALANAAGFRVVEIPVRHRARETGTSNYGLRVMLWRPLVDMLGIWWFIRRRCSDTERIPVQRDSSL